MRLWRGQRRLKPAAERGNGLKPVDRSWGDGRVRFVGVATAVLLLAACFRLITLLEVPPGLSQDEVLNADIVALIRAGEHALFFREGFGHEPLYHYWATPFQVLLGDNALAIRLPSVFLGLLLLALTMRWARRDFGTLTTVIAGLGLAVSWWAIIFSRVGIRPLLQPLFWVAAAWFWFKRPWLAGMLLGLSLYTYTGAQVSFAIPVLFGLGQLLLGNDQAARRTAAKSSAVILVMALLVSLPLYLTWRADPSLLQRVDQLGGPLAALGNGDPFPIVQAAANSLGYFGLTGDPRWTYTLPGRPLFDPVTAVVLLGGLVIAVRRLRQPKYTLLLSLFFSGLLPSMLTPQSPSIIRMVGALPAVFILLGLFFEWIGQKLTANYPRRQPAFVTALVLFLLINAGRTLQTARAWSNHEETRLNHYQTVLQEIGRHWQADPADHIIVADTFFETIDAASLRRNIGYDVQARWVQAGPPWAGALVFPEGEGNGRLYVPEFAPINPALLAAAGLPATPLFRSNTVPSFSIYELPGKLPKPEIETDVVFDGRLKLEGYSLTPSGGDSNWLLLTHWQVLQPLPWNLTAFVHLVDVDGNLLTQSDGLDAAPGQLQPGDHFLQAHKLENPPENNPSGLRLGLYTPENGQRLLIDGESLDFYSLEAPFIFDGK